MGGADNDGSNISSPLSDVDDKDTNDDEIEHMQLDHDNQDDDEAPDTPSPADVDDLATHEGDDSDSALSEAQSDEHSDDNDTEAETERLYDTPRNPRQRNVTDDYSNNEQNFEHTPSKLRSAATVNQNRDSDADSLSGDDASAISTPINHDDPLKKLSELTDAALGTGTTDRDRKRKRSAVAEQFDPDQPLKKRPASLPATDMDADEEINLNDEDETSANLQSAVQSAGEDVDTPQKEDQNTTDETSTERGTRSTRKITRNGAKRQNATNGTDVEEEPDQDTPQPQGEDEPETKDEEAEEEAEEENELAAKNAEECELGGI